VDSRRQEPRVTINKEFDSFDQFVREYVTNISRSGVFIKTPKPLPVGSIVNLRFTVVMDGVETIERLWHLDARLQVVICTAYSDHSWEDVLVRLDVQDRLVILKKPFDTVEVLQLASSLSEKWRLARQAPRPGDLRFPDRMAGARIDGDERAVGGGDVKLIVENCGAALRGARQRRPLVLPDDVAAARIEGIDAIELRDVHDAVMDDRHRLNRVLPGHPVHPLRLQTADGRGRQLLQR